MVIEMQLVKTRLKRFWLGRWIPLAVGLQAVCYSLVENLSTFCSCPETLQETEVKGSVLLNALMEISRLSSDGEVDTVGGRVGLLARFILKTEQRVHLKSYQRCWKESVSRDGVEDNLVDEKISIILD